MKIVVLDGYTLNPGDLSWEEMEKIGTLFVYDRTAYDESQQDLIVERAKDAEIVFTNKTPLTEPILSKCEKLRYIGVLATGYNVVDVQAANKRGITVTNIPTYGTPAVAQMVFALLLEVCHHVGAHDRSVKQGEWSANPDFCYWKHPLIELAGKTMGIVGYGKIGKNTAAIAKAFGMDVIAYDIAPSQEEEGVEFTSLDRLYEQADVISLHCPLFEQNTHMINKKAISKMKQGVILINTSRGPLIHEADLAEALNTNRVYAAALDVVSTEPIREDNPLLNAKNCIITPHIAWAPKESRVRLMQIAVDNLKAFLDGNPVNTVS